jgi:glycosyltransferase involved in cell wall biosynthesis
MVEWWRHRSQVAHCEETALLVPSAVLAEGGAMTLPVGKSSEVPLVSVVIPTYNQAEYLAIAIDSVLAQDYKNIECIVIDDGSTDGTSEVLERYRDRVTCVRQENGGQSRALNRGWAMSKGDILGYLSSDDRLLPQAISKLTRKLVGDPQCMVVYCDFELIDGRGQVIRRVQTEPYQERRLTEDLVCLPGPGALFRKEIFTRSGGWREDLRQCPDFEYWLRASRYGSFDRVSDCLAQFRIHGESASFRSVSEERSDEVILVILNFWSDKDRRRGRRAISAAYIKSARSHAQSYRPLRSLLRALSAFWHYPFSVFRIKNWQFVAAGFVRASYYRLIGNRNE